MNRHEFLTRLHAAYRPRNYLEIGIKDGQGLALSRTRTIGVDPAFRITSELTCDLQLVRQASDDFFARDDALAWFPQGVVDLTFIDGMHLAEFALRDFINAERRSAPTSVIVFDDMLPRVAAEASRVCKTYDWTGDVYKVAETLISHRPDLVVVPVDTAPTGVVVVIGLDADNSVLVERRDDIVAEYVRDDPQDVPADVLSRRHAAAPEAMLGSPIWAELATARDSGSRLPDVSELRQLRGTAQYVANPSKPKPWPPTRMTRARAALARRRHSDLSPPVA